jgi:hypothetical protein
MIPNLVNHTHTLGGIPNNLLNIKIRNSGLDYTSLAPV